MWMQRATNDQIQQVHVNISHKDSWSLKRRSFCHLPVTRSLLFLTFALSQLAHNRLWTLCGNTEPKELIKRMCTHVSETRFDILYVPSLSSSMSGLRAPMGLLGKSSLSRSICPLAIGDVSIPVILSCQSYICVWFRESQEREGGREERERLMHSLSSINHDVSPSYSVLQSKAGSQSSILI